MGILDDAIREHLELKRRRGADPSEIARLEHEALGPVRREPFEPTGREAASTDELDPRSVTGGGPGKPSEDEHEKTFEDDNHHEDAGDDWGVSFDEDLKRPGGRPSRADAGSAAADEDAGESAPGRGSRLWRRSRRRSIPPEDAPPTQVEAPADTPPRKEPAEYRVDDEFGTEDRQDDDAADTEEADMLEETPEFLQDAPEHDRLWFEQRPPRDFDFDD
jgi:hypothetical protein